MGREIRNSLLIVNILPHVVNLKTEREFTISYLENHSYNKCLLTISRKDKQFRMLYIKSKYSFET